MKTIILMFLLFVSSFVKSETQILKILVYDGNLMTVKAVSNNEVFTTGTHGEIFKTSNAGQTWVETPRVTPQAIFSIDFIDGDIGYAVGINGIYLKTIDGGNNWVILPSFTSATLRKIYIKNNNEFYAVGSFGAIYQTTNAGANWINRTIPSFFDHFYDVYFEGDNGYMVCDHDSLALWTSTNNGNTWTGTSISSPRIRGLAMHFSAGANYIAGINGQTGSPVVTRSLNGGSNWTTMQLESGVTPRGIGFVGNTGLCVGSTSNPAKLCRVYKTTDGINWATEAEYIGKEMFAMSTSSNYCYISGDSGNIYRIDVTVGISVTNSEIPSGFALSQNYPNPFNPTTKINFSIPKTGNVKLTVYNIVGQELKVLLNQSLNVGNYVQDFDAKNLTSGVYFYTLQSENFNATKRMVLLK